MKKLVLFLSFLIFCGINSFAQINIEIITPPHQSNDSIFRQVDKSPTFRGGNAAFYSFFKRSFKLPKTHRVQGRVLANFVIEVDGTLSNIKLLNSVNYLKDAEALRVIKRSQKWNPGERDGVKVRTMLTLPIRVDME